MLAVLLRVLQRACAARALRETNVLSGRRQGRSVNPAASCDQASKTSGGQHAFVVDTAKPSRFYNVGY